MTFEKYRLYISIESHVKSIIKKTTAAVIYD